MINTVSPSNWSLSSVTGKRQATSQGLNSQIQKAALDQEAAWDTIFQPELNTYERSTKCSPRVLNRTRSTFGLRVCTNPSSSKEMHR